MKIVLCALKCDLREEHEKDEAEGQALIQYQEGLEAAKRIGALRYLGMSPRDASEGSTVGS